jgi:hypothetical protein
MMMLIPIWKIVALQAIQSIVFKKAAIDGQAANTVCWETMRLSKKLSID